MFFGLDLIYIQLWKSHGQAQTVVHLLLVADGTSSGRALPLFALITCHPTMPPSSVCTMQWRRFTSKTYITCQNATKQCVLCSENTATILNSKCSEQYSYQRLTSHDNMPLCHQTGKLAVCMQCVLSERVSCQIQSPPTTNQTSKSSVLWNFSEKDSSKSVSMCSG